MSISERALLTRLTIGQWYNKKLDRGISDQIAEQYGASRSDIYVKQLIDPKELKDISRAVSSLRTCFYEYTLPWQDNGVRVLPAAVFFDFTEAMDKKKNIFLRRVNNFLAQYPEAIERARKDKGRLFDERDYPTSEHIKRSFHADLSFLPFPEAADFRVDLPDEQLKTIRRSAQQEIITSLADSEQAIFESLVYRLEKYIHSHENSVNRPRRSTLENLHKTATLAARLNVTDSPLISDLTYAAQRLTNVPEAKQLLERTQQHIATE